jgi:hypothetical protein
MKHIQLGEGEYSLVIEEKIRECIPAGISYGIDNDGSKTAGVFVRQEIMEKGLYENAGSETIWEATQNGLLGIDKIFLTIIFRDNENVNIGKMNFYFDLEDHLFRDNMVEWFAMIIEKNGVLGLCDGVIPTIMVDHVPLDLPRLIVMTKGRQKVE